MAADRQTQRDIGSGRSDTNITTATAAVADAPAGATGDAAGAWSTAGNRDISIACINRNKVRIGEIEVALRRAGLLV